MNVLELPGKILRKVFGTRNDRLLKRYGAIADKALAYEDEYRALTPEQLRAKTDEFKKRLAEGESPASLLPEAFAALREASDRAQKHRHFHCQLIGGQVLYGGNVAEMRTGEGKTIVCHLAAYLKFLEGKKVHIVTVNDYLVRRDAEFAQPIFALLGATVGYIQSQVDPGGHEGIRKQAYACDITYGTNAEFGFDYLRDNMKTRKEDQVQGRLDYAIVDEVDSILIDEARTPLIISGPAHDDVTRYKWADSLARSLVRKQVQLNNETAQRLAAWGDHPPEELLRNPKFEDAVKRFRVDPYMLTEDEAEAIGHRQLFVVQRDRKQAHITHEGIALAQDEAGVGSFYVGANMEYPHLIENAVRAHTVYERDKEYVVQDRQVIIVDEFTGRLMHGRQWSDGLHQAVEAKENVPIKEETQTLATITIQNFFKLYESLAGMTGTAMTESEEFMKIYKLEVVAIPTNRPVNRIDHNDKIYRTIAGKYDMIVEEINEMHRKGRPNDPFLLAEIFRRLKPIVAKEPGAEALRKEKLARIDEALARFEAAENGDTECIRFMMESYDFVMGNLAKGRPVLVGTTSVENSEKLSKLLEKTYGIEHEVLNAKNHAREAEIVAKAGHTHEPTRGTDKSPVGNVTIATNMAGRGTDIKLGPGVVYEACKVPENVRTLAPNYPERSLHLFPILSTKCCINCPEYDPSTNCAHCFKPKLDPRFPEMGRKICSLNAPCGLHIIGTERHEARRIDNQLRGRAGRQGDPGSSRFFLSLEDDLLKMFMPDWMLKMMEKMGFTEGMSIEAKQVSKGIERAQKKVEERNFGIRKHLLQWDEPMDYQRRAFYSQRQHILEGRNLSELIWHMIDDEIDGAVAQYLAEDYVARRISDWCRTALDVNIEASELEGEEDAAHLESRIREKAIDEATDSIRTTLGEYIDPDEEPSQWDLGGLMKWAQRMCNVSIPQNQLRKMSPAEIEDVLLEAARKHYSEVDLSAVEAYLDPGYGRRALADWARAKFAIELKSEQIAEGSAAEVADVIREKVRAAYARREIEYPVDALLNQVFAGVGTDNTYALQAVVGWANSKYNAGWTTDTLANKSIPEIRGMLLDLTRSFQEGGLEREIEAALARYPLTGDGAQSASAGSESAASASEGSNGTLIDWAKERFGKAVDLEALRQPNADVREVLRQAGQELMRWELTQLERYVLLRIYDQGWKDHLLEMDHLKYAIMQRPLGGDQTHPQSQFAIEGRDLFEQMWKSVRGRVTDMIFKVSVGDSTGSETTTRTMASGPQVQLRHDASTGAGFAAAGMTPDQQAAMRAQGEAKPVTIRRDQPRVGRNDPCPCGSGKKYKQCHGKGIR
ncbi:MAG TPA: SEC-C metal-binding domain-containing protein [Phycisphaerae bacterium]|nr:SEC-C metal-binding domain-containing protein [Phycisphaerae bacterium]HOJ56574.1 SEC-C metal-binding domain-containing protein [Phycisphaerae bacterium]HPU34759.1 SEC-C metal-binding domain-containing protein [Phycisphaerae bacterium]HQE45232.1 SEC-C metal-binding domain-containing protein [Phycisphaerae bacterium]HXK88075.1 SEC-C metal-binding domain-containing protein [Phycisphaerae bacterium]